MTFVAGMRRAAGRLLGRRGSPDIPSSLSSRFSEPAPGGLERLRISLENGFFARKPPGYLDTPEGGKDMSAHLTRRLESDRRLVIPWLASMLPLDGARVLEVGCGTGSSTVALAEQGAAVTGIDPDGTALVSAGQRLSAYGLEAVLLETGADSLQGLRESARFDLVIFWACLEHMTLEARLSSMRLTWGMLPPGGLWCAIETPNRLWHTDPHTSLLPFFHWLPDDLAVLYACRSPRKDFRERFSVSLGTEEDRADLAMWGRGVSFHEFELAIGPLAELDIAGCLDDWRTPAGGLLDRFRTVSPDRAYEDLLTRACPGLPREFLHRGLNLVLRKR